MQCVVPQFSFAQVWDDVSVSARTGQPQVAPTTNGAQTAQAHSPCTMFEPLSPSLLLPLGLQLVDTDADSNADTAMATDDLCFDDLFARLQDVADGNKKVGCGKEGRAPMLTPFDADEGADTDSESMCTTSETSYGEDCDHYAVVPGSPHDHAGCRYDQARTPHPNALGQHGLLSADTLAVPHLSSC